MKRFYIETYGCSSNQAGSEVILGILSRKGFKRVSSPNNSELNIINTCCVKLPTINRMFYRIRELSKFNKPLLVCGCLVENCRMEIERINKGASMFGPEHVDKIGNYLEKIIRGEKVFFSGESKNYFLCLPRKRRNPIVGIIKIGRGCLSNCSYCFEPFKGKLFSYPIKEIIKEVEKSLREGCKEIWISSLDNGCYGFDRGTNLAKLLKKICSIEERFFVRVGMMNPLHVKDFLKELIEAYESNKIFKFIHLPLQSGSNRILRLMRRGYKREEFIRVVNNFRKKFERITLSTDVIVGFPGETKKDFKETLALIKRIKPDIVNLSKFGSLPQTEASKLEQLDRKTINRRSVILSKLIKRIGLEKNREWLGWVGEILIDERGRNKTSIGRNFAYKPIVVKGDYPLGSFLKVKVVRITSTYLLGEVIKNK